jgi:phosphohistidine phosphatase
MRTLYILRHGEAESANGGEDRNRALTAAGQRAMQDLAPLLAAMERPPTVALCSPARRTRETQRAAAPALPVTVVDSLYNADAGHLYHAVQGIDDTHAAALLVGHNPGVHALAMKFALEGDAALREQVAISYRPGTLAQVQSTAARWEDVSPSNSVLVNLLVPPFAAGSGA